MSDPAVSLSGIQPPSTGVAATPTPEVTPLSSLLLSPLLSDQTFLLTLGAGVVTFLVLVFAVTKRQKKVGKRVGVGRVSGAGGRKGGSARVGALVGIPEAGKTAIFTKLAYDQLIPTHTSLLTNASFVSLPSSSSASSTSTSSTKVKILDVPGHPRLKDKLDEALLDADEVVLVVDVTSVQRNGGEVTELLSKVMIALASQYIANPTHSLPRLLILCHKADTLSRGSQTTQSPLPLDDKTTNLALERTKTVLSREMTKLKSARGVSGGKIQGIESIPNGSSSTRGGVLGTLFGGLFGAGGNKSEPSSGPSASQDENAAAQRDLEAAEAIIWGQGSGSGSGSNDFLWEQVQGVKIDWAASGMSGMKNVNAGTVAGSAVGGEQNPNAEDGLEQLREWLMDV